MKIRNGFVSNSSTSSYIIYGWYLEGTPHKEIVDLICKLFDKNPEDYYEMDQYDFYEEFCDEEISGYDLVFRNYPEKFLGLYLSGDCDLDPIINGEWKEKMEKFIEEHGNLKNDQPHLFNIVNEDH